MKYKPTIYYVNFNHVFCCLLILIALSLTKVNAQMVNYQQKYTNANFTKTIDQSKPVGAIAGSIDVTLSGGSNYTIPIQCPLGTNGMEPSISIQYNSQDNNGIAGWGWNIVGLSSISRTTKTNFLDDQVAPVKFTSEDVYSLDGQRLYANVGVYGANGTTYNKEQIDFSTITSYGNIGSGPEYITVRDKMGTLYEYGKSADARVLTDNGNDVMMWHLNKVVDVHGNYMVFQYQMNGRESLLSNIWYTGNSTLGFGPYNRITFDYVQGRIDKNTSFVGGASISSKSLLSTITIEGESSSPFKRYTFEYAQDDLYSYLQEVKEYGADNYTSQLNSTIFKYGESPVEFAKQDITFTNLQSINFNDYLSSLDIDGDGTSEVIVNETSFPGGVKCVSNSSIYKKATNGTYTYIGNYTPPNQNQLAYQNNKNGKVQYQYVSGTNLGVFSNADFNGDGKDDILNIAGNGVTSTQTLSSIGIVSFNVNTPYYDAITYNVPLPTANGFLDVEANKTFRCIGDFDGDGKTDFILITKKNINEPLVGWVTRYRAYLYSAQNNYQPASIKNLWLPGTSLPDVEYTNIVDAAAGADDEVNVINIDGDNKADLLVKIAGNSYAFSIAKNGIGEYEASTINVNVDLFERIIVQGDFNGDGNTDLISYKYPNTVEIHYSNGKTYSSSPFTFNMSNLEMESWIGAQNTAHPKDNLLVADVNGDGKSDIIHGKNSLIGNTCFGSLYYIDVYYSVGDNFLLKSFTFTNNVLECPQTGSSIFPDNAFLQSDVNGDGRVELLYRNTGNTNPVSKILFKENGQEGLLQKIIDGNNNLTELRYENITKGLPLHDAGPITPVSTNNFNVNYPLTSIQAPMYVVSSMAKPNGIGGANSSSFVYKNAVSQRSGRGFLGFLAVTATNPISNLKIIHNLMPKIDRSLLWISKIENYQFNSNTLITQQLFDNTFESYGGKLFQQRQSYDIHQHTLQGYSLKNTNVSFDYWGNVTQRKTELFKTALANIEESIANILYTTPGNVSTIPSVPMQVDVTKLRNGAQVVNSQQTFTYYSHGKLKDDVKFANLANPITTSYTYTIAGNPKTISTQGTGTAVRRKTLSYDNYYRYVTQNQNTTLPSNASTVFTENYVREPLWGNIISSSSINCQTTTYSYDAFGQIKQRNFKVNTPEAYSVVNSRGWYINGLMQTYETILQPGKPTLTTYFDKLGRKYLTSMMGFNNQAIYSQTTYDARGNVASQSNSYLANETPITTNYAYDDLNRQSSVSNPTAIINMAYAYSNGDLVTTTINASTNQTKSVTTDPSGKPISVTDHGGSLTYEYDSWGNEVKVKNGGNTYIEKVYDAYNRLASSTDANAGTKTLQYNNWGAIAQETDALNNTYNYVYDDIGRVIKKAGVEGEILYTYGDGNNQCANAYLTQIENFNGIKVDYMYDAYGRQTTKKTNIDNTDYIFKYAYDQYDNNISVEYPSGLKIYNEYTMDGYLNKVGYATSFNGQGQPTAFNYFYNAQEFNGMGQPLKYMLGNQYTTTKQYQYGYMTHHDAKLGNATLVDQNYSYNYANGNLLSRNENFNSNIQTESFTYDNLDRLRTSQVSLPNVTFNAINYNYDGNSTSKGNPTLNSNVANFGGYGAPKFHALAVATGFPTPVPGVAPAPIVPDPTIISDLGQEITYTPFNKTASIVEDNKELVYTYDAQYNRIKSVLTDNSTSDIITKYYMGSYETRTNAQAQTHKLHYIYGGDGLCAIVTMDDNNGTQIHYVYTDHLGSIATITDPSGNIEARQSFDAWGRMRDPDDWNTVYPSLFVNPNTPEWLYRGYTGHEHVPEFALINMNGRMYDPALGRMCSPDKYIQNKYFTQAYNRYSYCWNNPLKYTDPSGDIFVGTVHTFFRDLVDKALFQGGLDPTSSNARQNAWRNFDPSASWSKTNKAAIIDRGVFQTDINKSTGGRILQLASRLSVEYGQTFFGKMLSHARNVTGHVDNVDYFRGATVVNENRIGFDWGITLGNYINSQNMQANDEDHLFRHEYGHTLQSRLTGPLYLPMVGVPSLIGSGLWELGLHNHDDEWYERQANRMSFNYYEKKSPQVLVNDPWQEGPFPRENVVDWYFILTNPHAFMWWLSF